LKRKKGDVDVMGNSFAVTGTIQLSSTGKSLVLEIVNREGKDYIPIFDLKELIAGRKKTVTVWRPKPHAYRPRY